jgi:DNA polymerase III subunit alpha
MKEQMKVSMASRKQKVKISQQLLNALEEAQVHYKLN